MEAVNKKGEPRAGNSNLMDKSIITFTANGQDLKKTSGEKYFASDTKSYIQARFELSSHWNEFEKVVAIWHRGAEKHVTELDENGVCMVPEELMSNAGPIEMNLCATILEDGYVKYRLTSYPITALEIKKTRI